MTGWVGSPDVPQGEPLDRTLTEAEPDPGDESFRQAVVITNHEADGWHAVFIEGPNNEHQDEYHATRDEAIAWGRERCETVRAQMRGTSEYEYV